MEMEIGSETMAVVDGFFLFVSHVVSRRASFYMGIFTEVVAFNLTKAAPAIRAELELLVELPGCFPRGLVALGCLETCIFAFIVQISALKCPFLHKEK